MEKKLAEILKKRNINPSQHFLDLDGRLILIGENEIFTGIYKDLNGKFLKRGIVDEDLEFYQDDKGEFFDLKYPSVLHELQSKSIIENKQLFEGENKNNYPVKIDNNSQTISTSKIILNVKNEPQLEDDYYSEEDDESSFQIFTKKHKNILLLTGLSISLFACFIYFRNSNIREKITILQGINVRDADFSNSPKVGSIQANTEVELIGVGNKEKINGMEDQWYKIKTIDGLEGYVFGAYTNFKKNENSTLLNSQSIEENNISPIKQVFLPFVGTRYFNFYGGTGTGNSITIFEDGNTIIKSHGSADEFIDYEGPFTNPLSFPVGDEGEIYYRIDGNKISIITKNGKIETNCLGDGSPCTDLLTK